MVTLVFAVSSTFVSCKDYDDDINANTASIEALRTDLQTVKSNLESELSSTKSNLETQIASAKEALQNAINTKADAATVDALQKKVDNLETDLKAADAKLQTQIDAANNAIENLQSDVKDAQLTLAALTGDLSKLTGDLSEEVKAREALEKNLEIQQKALEALKEQAGKDNKALQDQITALQNDIKNFATDGTVTELQKKVKELSDNLTQVSKDIDALTVLIERALNSIALVPELYIDGIETIEFLSVNYTPLKDNYKGENGDDYSKIVNSFKAGEAITIDNGFTEATYRLNPTTVTKDCYDESGIEFVSTVAKTRSVTPVEGSPVMFNGVKSFEKGLMTVYVKKNPQFTSSLNKSNGEIYITALKVPRNAKKYEAADIYSENSRLSEKTIIPRIAAAVDGEWQAHSSENSVDPKSPLYHYSSYSDIKASRVDDSPLALVAKKINYKETFNLLELVTGCYDRGNGSHNEIDKNKLKTYGLTFRFSIPSEPYINAVDNNTDQQQFATVTKEGLISSKTPAGVTNNEAVVGKEPIVQVDLVDSVRNKLVDRRYLKIKWSLKELEPIQLKSKSSEAVLNCETMKAEYTWKEFIDEVYAKANLGSGLSQDKFEQLYPASNITVTPEGWTTNWATPKQTSAPASGSYSGCVPVFQSTTNEHGDALVANWILAPSDVKTIYNNSSNDTKTFKAKVEFKSAVPSEYPDMWFEWTFTIKLPELPTISGYYDQYWNQVGVQHDILPVQYNTPAQTEDHCVYNNNLMNAFTYTNGLIVKNIPSCGTWDMQFSYEQSISGYKPDYAASAVKTEANSTSADPSVFMSANKYVDSKHDIAFADFAGYKLMKGSTKALSMIWADDHTSWCGNPAHKMANLFADSDNAAVEALLNPLGATSEIGAEGTVAPVRTHNKKISMTVWATLNDWNYIPVKTYDICLIAPLRINTQDLLGNLQDGVLSGDVLDLSTAFTLDDFRGYLVANTPDGTFSGEQKKYTQSLWKYYEVHTPVYDTNGVRYTFKNVNGDAKIDNTLNYANSMTATALRTLTNGNIDLSMDVVGSNLKFKNNGGSNIEGDCYAYIPVSVKYGFGTLTATLKVHIYPHGQKPASAKKH